MFSTFCEICNEPVETSHDVPVALCEECQEAQEAAFMRDILPTLFPPHPSEGFDPTDLEPVDWRGAEEPF